MSNDFKIWTPNFLNHLGRAVWKIALKWRSKKKNSQQPPASHLKTVRKGHRNSYKICVFQCTDAIFCTQFQTAHSIQNISITDTVIESNFKQCRNCSMNMLIVTWLVNLSILGMVHLVHVHELFLTTDVPSRLYRFIDSLRHIYVSKLSSDNGLSSGRRQAIITTNDGILLIWRLGTQFSEPLNEIHIFQFKKMSLKMPSAKWLPFVLI